MTDIYTDRWFHRLGFGRSPEHRAAIRNAREQKALADKYARKATMTDIELRPGHIFQIAGRVVLDIYVQPWPGPRSYRMITEDNYEWDVTFPKDVTLPPDGPPRVELQLLPWMEARDDG